MQKFNLYGRLFACLEVIQENGWLPSPNSGSFLNGNFDQARLSFLLRNHRRKLNRMDSRMAKVLEQELVSIFHALPVEPFPVIQSFFEQRELTTGYYDQILKLNKELIAAVS